MPTPAQPKPQPQVYDVGRIVRDYTMTLLHPTRAGEDQEVTLTRQGDMYTGEVKIPRPGRWQGARWSANALRFSEPGSRYGRTGRARRRSRPRVAAIAVC